jgi:hypothetical protein
LGGFGVIEFKHLDRALKLRQFYRAGKTSHPIAELQTLEKIEPFHTPYSTDEVITQEVKIIATELACEQMKNKEAGLQWLPGLQISKVHEYFNVQGMPVHYARILERDNARCIGEINQLKICPRLGNKSRLAIRWIEKNLWPLLEDSESVLLEWQQSKENFGIYTDEINIDLTMLNSSKLIRNGIMALTMAIDKPISLSYKYPTICELNNPGKESAALQKIAKIRSVRLRNHMLRILNGDVFSKERMCRFGMIDEQQCDRCHQVETRDHLLFQCAAVRNMWGFLDKIHQKIHRRPFVVNERNILGCGDNYNSLATTTIIAELNKSNVINRRQFATENELLIFISFIIRREERWSRQYKTKLQNSWLKWISYINLTLGDVEGGAGVSGDMIPVDPDQLPTAGREVESDEDLQSTAPVPVMNVTVVGVNTVAQATINGDGHDHGHPP